jgi:arylsulfatase A-like enzyme
MKRLQQILVAAAAATTLHMAQATEQRPNILLIITDQQRFDMLGCAGNRWVKTPHLDRLAATGTRFERAFCAFPLCSPSRFSMFSGVMPSRIHQENNNVVPVPQSVLDHAMGSVLGRAGYETVYGGKIHLPCPNRPQSAGYGFQRNLTTDSRDELAAKCAAFLAEKHERPFLLVASFNNPHDICSMGIRDFAKASPPKKPAHEDPQALVCLYAALQRPAGVSDGEFFGKLCPPMPSNQEESAGLADVMGFKGGMIVFEQTQWSERDWQLHRWAYARLTEQVDAQIGVVLDALRGAGLEKTTLVVEVSDHGEMDGSHRLGHKQFLYDEAIRVPLIVSWPGQTQAGAVDREHLVSTGLDLIPTLCDFAGVPVPPELKGRSVKPLAEGRPVRDWRQGLVIENPNGVAYRTAHSKYVVSHQKNSPLKEAVLDLDQCPGETHNAATDPEGFQRLAEGRAQLLEWYREHGEILNPRCNSAQAE